MADDEGKSAGPFRQRLIERIAARDAALASPVVSHSVSNSEARQMEQKRIRQANQIVTAFFRKFRPGEVLSRMAEDACVVTGFCAKTERRWIKYVLEKIEPLTKKGRGRLSAMDEAPCWGVFHETFTENFFNSVNS